MRPRPSPSGTRRRCTQQAAHAHPAQTNVCSFSPLAALFFHLCFPLFFSSASSHPAPHSVTRRGCDLDATDFKGRTPLAIACMAGNSPLPPAHTLPRSPRFNRSSMSLYNCIIRSSIFFVVPFVMSPLPSCPPPPPRFGASHPTPPALRCYSYWRGKQALFQCKVVTLCSAVGRCVASLRGSCRGPCLPQ